MIFDHFKPLLPELYAIEVSETPRQQLSMNLNVNEIFYSLREGGRTDGIHLHPSGQVQLMRFCDTDFERE